MSQKFSENKNRSTPISLDLTNSSQDIPWTSKENNSPCSEHILNEEFQTSQLIPSRQQTSLGNFDFNVDLEPGLSPIQASPTPPVSPPPGYPQSPNSQQLPDSPQSTDSLQSLDSPQPPVSQLSSLSSSTSELPNEIFNMVLDEPLAAKACCNQKNVSPNQPVNFKYPKREYKDSNWSFQRQWYKPRKWLHYNEQKYSVTCYVCWHAHLHHILPNMKIDYAFIESGYTNWKNATDTKRALINMKNQRFIVLQSIVL